MTDADPSIDRPSLTAPEPTRSPIPVTIHVGRYAWLAIAAVVVLWLARPVLGPFVIAAVIAYAFSPVVTAAQRRTRWPRLVVVGVGYVAAVALLVLAAVALSGPVSSEIQSLSASGHDTLSTAIRQLIGGETIEIAGQTVTASDLAAQVRERLSSFVSSPSDAVHALTLLGDTALEVVLALIVTFYFLVDGERLRDGAIGFLPPQHRRHVSEVLGRIHDVLGHWLRGTLLLVVLISAIVYVILGPILHLPYALAIAILTGILEIIPLVGPIVAAAIAALDAYATGGAGLAVLVIVIYIVIRQIEDQVVMPVVIGRAVHLHPVVTIFAVLVGLQTYGVLGGLLGVPVAAALNVVARELARERERRELVVASS